MKNNAISQSLVRVLKEFGIVGLVTYVGGMILLTSFTFERDLQKQLIFGFVGLYLLSSSIFIAYFRLKIQKDREKALISMAENTCNRLAEQLGKGLTDHQTDGIVQKIRQTQSNLISAIVKDKS